MKANEEKRTYRLIESDHYCKDRKRHQYFYRERKNTFNYCHWCGQKLKYRIVKREIK